MNNAEALVKNYLLAKRAAVIWLQNVLQDESLGLDVKDDFFHQLIDGVILCKVMKRISPNLIPRIKEPTTSKNSKRATTTVFRTNENVSFFVQACVEIGVPRQKRFVLHDLVNKKGVAFSYSSTKRVLECLEALCELANGAKRYEFHVKWPVLDATKEKFSMEETEIVKKMVEEFLKTEERKEIMEKRVSTSAFRQPDMASQASAASPAAAAATSPSSVSVTVGSPPGKPASFSATPAASTPTPGPASAAGPYNPAAQEAKAKEREKIRHRAASKLQAVVRGWLARNRYRAMVRSQAYRDHVAQEILATERVYVEKLEFLVREVLQPLREPQKEPILSEPEIRAIFSETESILNYNRLLLLKLEERVAKWNVAQKLGDSFLFVANYLKIYSQYCTNYHEAMRVLSECKKLPKFKKFLDDLKKRSHDIEHRGLEDYLIRPVQRIPRYYLLLQDLVKHTSKDHPDYADLAAAAQKVQAVAEYMNIKKREAENIMKVTEIQDMIDGEYEALAKPHRRFVREGQLQEVGKGTTRKVAVVLFLFNDLLVITRPQGSSFLSRSKSPRLLFTAMFPLAGTQTISLDNSTVFQNAFQIFRTKSKRSITLIASSAESKEEWLSAIDAEIQGATEQEHAQDERITSTVKGKVQDSLAKLEQQYQNGDPSFLAKLRAKSEAIDVNPGSPPSAGGSPREAPLSSSAGSSADGDNLGSSSSERRMSLREKRTMLQQNARRSGSIVGGQSPVISLTASPTTTTAATSPSSPPNPMTSSF